MTAARLGALLASLALAGLVGVAVHHFSQPKRLYTVFRAELKVIGVVGPWPEGSEDLCRGRADAGMRKAWDDAEVMRLLPNVVCEWHRRPPEVEGGRAVASLGGAWTGDRVAGPANAPKRD